MSDVLSVDPAVLFRGIDGAPTRTPAGWRIATVIAGVLVMAAVLVALPDPLFAAAFIGVIATLLVLLDLIVTVVQRLARRLDRHSLLEGRFALRLAVANLQRRESPLRTALLSLGSALTLLVACATLVAALIKVIDETIPEESPGLVLYDIAPHQVDGVTAALDTAGARRVDIAPLVLGRLAAVNGEPLSSSLDPERQREARDEHKLTYRANDIDDVIMARGQWWPAGPQVIPQVAMEDREADQLGLLVGDTLTISIEDRELTAELSGIYRQQGLQTRFWFEGIFSDGALEGFISRYVGAAYLDDPAAIRAQLAIADAAPNVVTVRTASIIEAARSLLNQGVVALALVAGVALCVSLLVLTSVVATSRARQLHESTILLAVGARLGTIRRSLTLEYALLAAVTSLFALTLGTAIAVPVLVYLFKLPPAAPLWPGLLTAFGVSGTCLYLGAGYLLRRLRLQPAQLLRSGT